MLRLIALLCLVAASACMPSRAAESYDNCTGYIDTVPTQIQYPGIWCLRKDLITAITSGSAILIYPLGNSLPGDFVIDCNGFRLDGLAAGNSTQANGISSSPLDGFRGVTVRNCRIRGFNTGIRLLRGNHLVEDNLLDRNRVIGIYVGNSEIGVVRRNRVLNTGGYAYSADQPAYVWGIEASTDIIDNTVAGLFTTQPPAVMIGIRASGTSTSAEGNRVTGLAPPNAFQPHGIYAGSSNIRIRNNHIASGAADNVNGTGIWGAGNAFCTGNSIAGLTNGIEACHLGDGNVVH